MAGGVGGAKLVWGLAQLLPPERLTVLGNTGDDFHHLGLTICPDVDTLMYTLAGWADPHAGWGVRDDTFEMMGMLSCYGGPGWFQLGDRDLATHLLRSEMLAAGRTLTAVTAHLSRRLGVEHPLLPMSDQPAPTMLDTDQGLISFQDWFVRRRWEPAVRRVVLPQPPPPASPAVRDALEAADLVLLAPSNPLLSIAPILHLGGLRPCLEKRPVVAVSPIIGGQAVKGPAAKMMAELGMEVSARGVARYYGPDLLDAFVLDHRDADLAPSVEAMGIPTLVTATWMRSPPDRLVLAQTILDWLAHFDLDRGG